MNSKTQLDPNPLKPMFTLRFLRALSRINTLHRSSSLSCRGRKIKRAADVAAAAATGPKRAWSRAVLLNVQRRRALARRRTAGMQPNFPSKHRCKIVRRATREKDDYRKKCLHQGSAVDQRCNQGRADELRRLVPGGGAMEFCSLLEETADYIQALATQVHEMKALADSLNL